MKLVDANILLYAVDERAQQYDATVVTFDNDFGRYTGVRWESPNGA